MLRDKEAVEILFDELAERFRDRPGGYTRVVRLARPRLGDARRPRHYRVCRRARPDQASGAARPKSSKPMRLPNPHRLPNLTQLRTDSPRTATDSVYFLLRRKDARMRGRAAENRHIRFLRRDGAALYRRHRPRRRTAPRRYGSSGCLIRSDQTPRAAWPPGQAHAHAVRGRLADHPSAADDCGPASG